MTKKRVLFVCVHNSARSQMAESYLNFMAPDRFEAVSAGIEPGRLNPFVVRAMSLDGIDISWNKTKSADGFKGAKFDYVIAVCDKSAADRCPIVPVSGEKLHWPFEDPSSFCGPESERLGFTIMVRDSIKAKLIEWIKTV